MIIFPCANCGAGSPAFPVTSGYACPCGAEYQILEHHCDRDPGIAILLLPRGYENAPSKPCRSCRAPLPDVALPDIALFADERGRIFIVRQRGARCLHCGVPYPIRYDRNAAPHWRHLSAAAAAARN